VLIDFTFGLPFCLHIPNGEYHVEIPEGGNILLRLEKRIPKNYDERIGYRGLTEQDLKGVHKLYIVNQESKFEGSRYKVINATEISKVTEFCEVVSFEDENGNTWFPDIADHSPSNEPKFTGLKIFLNPEVIRDRFGRLRYSRVTVLSDSLETSRARIVSAVNKLIDAYRIASNEYWLFHIREDDILFVISESEFNYEGLGKVRPDISGQDLDHLRSLLLAKESPSTFYLLFLSAKNAVFEENYSLAIIYAITSIESLVRMYLDKLADEKSLPHTTSKRLQNMSLFQLVTVVLRIALPKDELSDELIEEFVKANQLRNKIIHKAVMNITKDSAEKANQMTLNIMNVLYPKIVS
jgi:hypothetical protein